MSTAFTDRNQQKDESELVQALVADADAEKKEDPTQKLLVREDVSRGYVADAESR